MSDTLTNIQTDARFWASDRELTLTTGDNLRIANGIYQGMLTPGYKFLGVSIGRRWPEVTRQDTSLTMVVGQENYTWPASPDFNEPYFIEGLNSSASNEPYPIDAAPDMESWSFYDQTGNAEPLFWRLIDVSAVLTLSLRPNPIRTDGIRITGCIEGTAWTTGSSTTIFKHVNSDHALSMLIGAHFQSKRGNANRAMELVDMAAGLLPVNDMSPALTSRGRVRPWGNNSRRGMGK